MTRNAAALKAADALHNAQSILRDVRCSGLDALCRFKSSPEETLWYYGALADKLRNRLERNPLALELDEAVFALTGEVDRLLCSVTATRRARSVAPTTRRQRMSGNRKRWVYSHEWRRIAHPVAGAWRRRLAPPAGGDDQWVEGRSALEAARAWSASTVPSDVLEVLRRVASWTTSVPRPFLPSQ